MGILSSLFEKRSGISTLAQPAQWLIDALGGRGTSSGVKVNEETAMRSTAVYACVRIIAETVASLPLIVYRRMGNGKQREPTHPLYQLLHDQPNEEMTAFTYRETAMSHLLLWGNSYSEIEYNQSGEVRALWPIPPWLVTPERPDNGVIQYRVQTTDGERILPFERVLHVPGLSFNGLVGLSPIQLAREAIGMALAVEEYGARFFGNGARPGGVLEHPGKLSKDAQDRLRDSWNEMHQGLDKQHRIAILEEGMTYKSVGIPPEDAQFLETRKFQINEIARIFRVPPHLIGDLERATFSNIEHQSIEFVVHTIRPWLVRWEQAIQMKLFGLSERNVLFAEFLVDGLLRGDIKSRYEAYAIARQNGWLSADDIRELENMNPLPDGKGQVYLVNGNMMPIDQQNQSKVTQPDKGVKTT